MNGRWYAAGLAITMLGAVVCADEWTENFDAYETGSPLDGQGGWIATPIDSVIVTDDEALSAPNALLIVGADVGLHNIKKQGNNGQRYCDQPLIVPADHPRVQLHLLFYLATLNTLQVLA